MAGAARCSPCSYGSSMRYNPRRHLQAPIGALKDGVASITRRQGRLNPIRSRQASQRFRRGATFAAPVAKCTYNEQILVFDALPLQYVRSSTPDGRPVGP
jgi:hypothetical protein